MESSENIIKNILENLDNKERKIMIDICWKLYLKHEKQLKVEDVDPETGEV